MVRTMMFDTLKYTKELEAAGVNNKEAEAHARALATLFEGHEEHLATKGDIASAVIALKNEIDTLRNDINLKFVQADNKIDALRSEMDLNFAQVDSKFAKMESKFFGTKSELIQWSIAIAGAQIGFIIAAFKLLH